MLRHALGHHQAGRLAEAERLYREVLAIDAQQPDSLHLLGMIAHATGCHEAAVELIRKAIAINKGVAAYHSNLATVLRALGRLDEAAACCQRAVALKPDFVEAHTSLGNILQARGKLDEAVACHQRALALKPDCAQAHYNLGIVRQAQGKLDEAAANYRQALDLDPRYAEAHGNLGTALQAQGKLNEAVASYQRALDLKPDYAKAHANLGIVLQALERLHDAVASYQRALALQPDDAEVWNNLGTACHAHHKLDAAVASYERALALQPDDAEVWNNLGTACHAHNKLDAAMASYERALALRPDSPQAHHNLGCLLYALGGVDDALDRYQRALALEPDYPQARFSQSVAQLHRADFAAGWHNYESRWQTKEHETPMRAYRQPLWTGGKLASGRLLIWGEQGIGDEIMFAGLIPDVIRTGNRCVLHCDARLQPLFARSFPGIDVVTGGDPGNQPELEITAHLPSGSLPALFRVTDAAFAATTSPYLLADPEERNRFRTRYADGRRLVGLAWYTKNRKMGRQRSIDLSLFAPLFARPEIRWVSLQYGDPDALEEQAEAARAPVFIDRSVNQLSNIDVFAAQIAAMDLVVTIDNSTAHLAGALGVPTWLLLPFASDWRWLEARAESPWYPTMRLFRQPKLADWQSVMQAVQGAL